MIKKKIKNLINKLSFSDFDGFRTVFVTKKTYKKFAKKEELIFIRKIKSQLLDTKFSNLLNSDFNDISINQYLEQYLVNSNSNFIKRFFFYFGKKDDIFSFSLPSKWLKIIYQNKIKVNFFKSKIFWISYILYRYFCGVGTFIKLVVKYLSNKIDKDYEYNHLISNNYSIFCGFDSNERHTSLIEYHKKLQLKDNIIFAGYGNKIKKDNYLNHNTYEIFLKRLNIFKFIFYFIKFQILIFLNLFCFKWGHALLLDELVLSSLVKASSHKLPNKLYFVWYSNTFKPLWVEELEKKGVDVNLYFNASINNLSESNEELQPIENIGLKIYTWKNYISWNSYLEEILKKKTNFNFNFIKIDFLNLENYNKSISLLKQKLDNQNYLIVFPYFNPKNHHGIEKLAEYLYRKDNILENFIDDIIYANSNTNFKIVVNKKINLINKEYKKIQKFYENLKDKNITVIEGEIDIFSLINHSVASISLPFTSTALFAEKLKIKSIYYDPLNYVNQKDIFAQGISLISDKENLKKFLDTLNN